MRVLSAWMAAWLGACWLLALAAYLSGSDSAGTALVMCPLLYAFYLCIAGAAYLWDWLFPRP